MSADQAPGRTRTIRSPRTERRGWLEPGVRMSFSPAVRDQSMHVGGRTLDGDAQAGGRLHSPRPGARPLSKGRGRGAELGAFSWPSRRRPCRRRLTTGRWSPWRGRSRRRSIPARTAPLGGHLWWRRRKSGCRDRDGPRRRRRIAGLARPGSEDGSLGLQVLGGEVRAIGSRSSHHREPRQCL